MHVYGCVSLGQEKGLGFVSSMRMFVCVRACVRACVRMCVRVSACVAVCVAYLSLVGYDQVVALLVVVGSESNNSLLVLIDARYPTRAKQAVVLCHAQWLALLPRGRPVLH